MMICRCADIEDWAEILYLWRQLQNDPHQMGKIDGDESTLKGFLKGSFSSQYLKFWVVVDGGHVMAMAIAQISVTPQPLPDTGQVLMTPALFIRAVYADRGGNPEAVKLLSKTGEEFARGAGCGSIFGNCRMDFPHKAAMRVYGYESTHVVMRKDLK